jgi:hypothetical protein
MGMMNRRQFLSAWIFQRGPAPLEVRVMEIFSASEGPSAVLVHHASEAGRDAFAEWLRANKGRRIICRLHSEPQWMAGFSALRCASDAE